MSLQTPASSRSVGASDTTSPLHGDITKLASECTSAKALFSRGLNRIAAHLECPYAAIYVQYASDVIEDQCHFGSTDPSFWRPTVQEALTTAISSSQPRAKLLSARNAQLELGLIAVPLYTNEGASVGGMALVSKLTESEIPDRVALLESLGALMVRLAGEMKAKASSPDRSQTTGANRALLKATSCGSPRELAFTIVNSIRNNTGCHQVALSMVVNGKIRLLAISGQDDVREQTPGVQAIQQAMEECLDLGEPILMQEPSGSEDSAPRTGHRLHRAWYQLSNNCPVASVPLMDGDQCLAVLSLQQKNDTQIPANLLGQISSTVGPFAPALFLLDKADRSVWRHAREAFGQSCKDLVRPGSYARKAGVLFAVGFACWMLFGRMDYQISVTGTLQPAVLRHVGVPHEAVLASADRIAGDVVKAGDVLCRIDTRELQLQRAERQAALEVAEQQTQRAMASGAAVEARLAGMEAQLIRTQLATIDHRIEQAVVRSPLDGVVIQGDLRTKIGSVLPQGAPLFQVAPYQGWIVELRIPEYASLDIRPGLQGRYVPNARPESAQRFRLTQLQPSAVVADLQSVFVAEAELETSEPWLRPGMEGAAKISVARRPVWWVLFHSVTDYLRMKLWL